MSQEAVCSTCGARYRVVEGILDLRAEADEAPPLSEVEAFILDHPDWETEALLAERFRASGHPLADYYATYNRDAAREQRMGTLFAGAYESQQERAVLLDIGCGGGALFESERRLYPWIVGVDRSLEQLLYASRRLRARRLDHIILLCADAYDLPLFPDSVDAVWALNTVEHLTDIERFFAEAARVLKAGGWFVGDSRNRFDLLMLEPHVRLPWVGFLPRGWQERYVALFRGQQWAARYVEGTRLRSLWEIERLARRFFTRSSIQLPDVGAYGASRRAASWVRRVVQAPLVGTALRPIFPTYLVVGQK